MGLRSAYCSAAPRHMPNSIRLRRQTGLCLFVRHHVGRPTTVVAEISLRSHPLRSAGMLTALTCRHIQATAAVPTVLGHIPLFHIPHCQCPRSGDDWRDPKKLSSNILNKFGRQIFRRVVVANSIEAVDATRRSSRVPLQLAVWTYRYSVISAFFFCLKPRSQRMNRTRLKSAAAVRGEQTGVCELRVHRFIWTQLFSTRVQFSSCAVNDALDALDAE